MSEAEYTGLLTRRKRESRAPATIFAVPRVPRKTSRSKLETELEFQLQSAGAFCRSEYRPFKERLWRIDFAWPDLSLGIEVDGSVHRIKSRFHGDLEKNAALLLAGWRILHVGREQIKNGKALEWVLCLLRGSSTTVLDFWVRRTESRKRLTKSYL
jgi:very-short-patch-repair endonuclease